MVSDCTSICSSLMPPPFVLSLPRLCSWLSLVYLWATPAPRATPTPTHPPRALEPTLQFHHLHLLQAKLSLALALLDSSVSLSCISLAPAHLSRYLFPSQYVPLYCVTNSSYILAPTSADTALLSLPMCFQILQFSQASAYTCHLHRPAGP
jgi:hypothetical protein